MIFGVEERERVRAWILARARRDARIVAGAVVGSEACAVLHRARQDVAGGALDRPRARSGADARLSPARARDGARARLRSPAGRAAGEGGGGPGAIARTRGAAARPRRRDRRALGRSG